MLDKKIKNIFLIAMIFVSIISFLVVLCCNSTIETRYLCLLPLFLIFGLLVYLLANKNSVMYIGSFIIIVSYFIRMSVAPAFMAIGDYFSTKSSELDYNTAILFMIYEFIFVFFILSFLSKNKNINAGKWNESTEKPENNENIKFKVNKNMKLIIFFLIIICTLFCFRYPQILNSFKFGVLSNSDLIQWQKKYNFSLNSMPKLIFYMISWCIKIIKEVIIFIILLAIKNKKNSKFKFISSLAIILIGSLISDDTLAQNLYFACIYFLLLTEFYPENKKKIYIILSITVGLIFFYGLISEKISDYNYKETAYNIANTLQVYFTGVYNVAVSLKLKVENPLKIIAGDFLRSIPLFKTFFVNMQTSTTVFCSYINDEYNSQIVPSLGQSIFLFGKIFAPLIASLFTIITVKCESKIKKIDNYFDKFICYIIIVKLACIPVIYNGQIFLQGLFGTILPLVIISLFNKKEKKYD